MSGPARRCPLRHSRGSPVLQRRRCSWSSVRIVLLVARPRDRSPVPRRGLLLETMGADLHKVAGQPVGQHRARSALDRCSPRLRQIFDCGRAGRNSCGVPDPCDQRMRPPILSYRSTRTRDAIPIQRRATDCVAAVWRWQYRLSCVVDREKADKAQKTGARHEHNDDDHGGPAPLAERGERIRNHRLMPRRAVERGSSGRRTADQNLLLDPLSMLLADIASV